MRDLHICSSIEELNQYCRVDSLKCDRGDVERLISTRFSEAESCKMIDEEKAYILYGQGLRIFEKFASDKAVNFSEKLKLDYSKAKNSVKNLHERLTVRYSELDLYSRLNSLSICSDELGSKSIRMNADKNEPKHFPGRWIPPDSLYERLNTGKTIFFIDVRDKDSFRQRRIKKPTQINLGDKSKLSSGYTVTSIEKNLSACELEYWHSRNDASLIVLIDEDSGRELIENPDEAENFTLPTRHPLKIIYDALNTYNAEKSLLPPTVFLSGGIHEFAKRYPTIISLAPVSKKSSTNSNFNISSSIDYPSLVGGRMLLEDVASSLGTRSPSHSPPKTYAELSMLINRELANEPSVLKTLSDDEDLSQVLPDTATNFVPKVDSKSDIRIRPSFDRSKKPITIKKESPPSPVVRPPLDAKALTPTIDRSKKPSDSYLGAKSFLSVSSSSEALNNFIAPNGEVCDPAHVSVDTAKSKPSIESSLPIPVYTNKPLRRGLVNIGNTCYMNSTLQALLHTSDLRKFFFTFDRRNITPKKSGLSVLFSQLLKELHSDHPEPLKPHKFKIAIGLLNSMFKGSEQQDSHEFLMLLLDHLHDDLNVAKKLSLNILRQSIHEEPTSSEHDQVDPNKLAFNSWTRNRNTDDSEILNWFNGQLRSTVRCKECGRRSFTFDEFMYLSLSVQNSHSNTLRSCIAQFFKEEELSGSSRWMCPGCKKPRDAIKTFDIWRLPKYLIIHLKRFQCFGSCQKIESNVDFPLVELNLANVVPQVDNSACEYSLYAVVNHYGTMESGHYTAFCYDDVDACWYKFDDDVVSRISRDRVQTNAAYILFYKNSRI